MNERKIQRKYKIETAKMLFCIPPQDATGRHKRPQNAYLQYE